MSAIQTCARLALPKSLAWFKICIYMVYYWATSKIKLSTGNSGFFEWIHFSNVYTHIICFLLMPLVSLCCRLWHLIVRFLCCRSLRSSPGTLYCRRWRQQRLESWIHFNVVINTVFIISCCYNNTFHVCDKCDSRFGIFLSITTQQSIHLLHLSVYEPWPG